MLLALCAGNSSVTGEFSSPHKASDTELWHFLWYVLNKRLSKQSWAWWLETPSRSLWSHIHCFLVCFTNTPPLHSCPNSMEVNLVGNKSQKGHSKANRNKMSASTIMKCVVQVRYVLMLTVPSVNIYGRQHLHSSISQPITLSQSPLDTFQQHISVYCQIRLLYQKETSWHLNAYYLY